ncbi:hypothetical protein [Arcobacter sp.]|uniref:capsular polysaccharide export protein, LipB/KpsS family n=1 Tax=Arcobacter sp. TaxID=1872629 RepID=UPI003D095F34
MTNVFYMSYQPYFVEMAKILYKEDDFQPVYWNIVNDIENNIKDVFENCILHNHYDAIKGIPPKELANILLEPLCPKTLQKLSQCERIALRMMERNDTYADNFAHRDRVLLYKYFVQYWVAIINKLKPKYIIFEEEPHQASEYVLYKVAKMMNVETIMFIRTTIDQRMYPVNEFETGSEIIKKKYETILNQKNKLEISNEIEKYLEKIQGNYSEVISLHLYDQTDNINNLLDEKSKFLKRLKKIFSFSINLKKFKIQIKLLLDFNSQYFKSDQKQYFKSFKNSNLKYIEHIYFKSKSIIKKYFLKKYYDKISEKSVDLTIPYIFCAIHYQPEKTTCPLGGDFDDQLYMIELLSKTMPKGWTLYVKEHPSQFVTSYARYGEHFRSYGYYDQIKKLKNVKLVSIKTDTFSLIDNAKAVATVTSTSAWEAVIRGVPSLTFGYSWFNHCNGIFYVKSLKDLEDFFELIHQNNYKPNIEDIKCFLTILEKNTFKSVIGGEGVQKYFNISVKQNALGHIKAIRNLIDFNKLKEN